MTAFGCVCEYGDGKFTVLCGAHQLEVHMAVEKERERCAQLVNDWAKAYPTTIFPDAGLGKHSATVDGCHAKALRETLPVVAEAIRGDELDQDKRKNEGKYTDMTGV